MGRYPKGPLCHGVKWYLVSLFNVNLIQSFPNYSLSQGLWWRLQVHVWSTVLYFSTEHEVYFNLQKY